MHVNNLFLFIYLNTATSWLNMTAGKESAITMCEILSANNSGFKLPSRHIHFHNKYDHSPRVISVLVRISFIK